MRTEDTILDKILFAIRETAPPLPRRHHSYCEWQR